MPNDHDQQFDWSVATESPRCAKKKKWTGREEGGEDEEREGKQTETVERKEKLVLLTNP